MGSASPFDQHHPSRPSRLSTQVLVAGEAEPEQWGDTDFSNILGMLSINQK